MKATTTSSLELLIANFQLPSEYLADISSYFLPLARNLAETIDKDEQTIFGLQGCQGSGKSTLVAFLSVLFAEEFGLENCVVSLDDFYLNQRERNLLAQEVHPLLATRGVPGTHDIDLLSCVIDKFLSKQSLTLPKFDKATDNPCPPDDWTSLAKPPPLMILEGWCLGIPAQETHQLANAINCLEEKEDQDGRWRQYVNQQIAQNYQPVYDQIYSLCVLQAPGWECVYQWRLRQEQQLLSQNLSSSHKSHAQTLAIMSEHELKRFVQHFQRLSQHGFNCMSQLADYQLSLNSDHQIIDCRI